MDDYLHRRAALLPAYAARASQLLQHQPYRLLATQPWTDVSYYGFDTRRHLACAGGLVPYGLGELQQQQQQQQQHAVLVSRPLDLSLATRDRYVSDLEARNRASRTQSQSKRSRTADIREVSRKKPRELQDVKKDSDKEEEQNERLQEVIMLHNLWKSGEKGAASKDESKGRKSRQKNNNNSKRSNQNGDGVKNDCSDKLADQSDQLPTSTWKDFSVTDPDENNGTWEQQQAKQESEPQEVGWSMASRPETEKGNSLNAVTVKPDIEKQKMHRLLGVQYAALELVKEFLGSESDIDDDSDEDLDEEMEEVEADQEFEAVVEAPERIKGREEKAFDFFVSLINENQELRKAYEECCNWGTFECLVCAAAGRNLAKRFSDLVGLVQHARKVLNTKRRPEHRGYGRAVCALLGWDPSRDPVLPRTVTIHPRGCIPPPDEDRQDNEVTWSESTKVMDGRLEAKAEDRSESNGFKTDKNNTIETTGEVIVDIQASVFDKVSSVMERKGGWEKCASAVEKERNHAVKAENNGSALLHHANVNDYAVMDEFGKDSKDSGANGGEGLHIEKTSDIQYDDHDKLVPMAHGSSLAAVSSR